MVLMNRKSKSAIKFLSYNIGQYLNEFCGPFYGCKYAIKVYYSPPRPIQLPHNVKRYLMTFVQSDQSQILEEIGVCFASASCF